LSNTLKGLDSEDIPDEFKKIVERNIILENTNIIYDSDSYADDLPYWIKVKNKKHLIIPYTLDNNDMRFSTLQGFNTGEDFYNYLKNLKKY